MDKPASLGLVCVICGSPLKISSDHYYCEHCGNEFLIKQKGDLSQADSASKIKNLDEEISTLNKKRRSKLKELYRVRQQIKLSGTTRLFQIFFGLSFVYIFGFILFSIINNLLSSPTFIDSFLRSAAARPVFFIFIFIFIVSGIYLLWFPSSDKKEFMKKDKILDKEVQELDQKLLMMNKELSNLWGN